MNKNSIVHVVPYYPPHLGGMENVACAIAQELAKIRPVCVLTTNCGAKGAPLLEYSDGLTVRRLRAREIANIPVAPSLIFRLLMAPRQSIVHVHVAQALVPEMVWLTRRIRNGKFVAHFHLDVAPSGRFGSVFLWYKKRILGYTLRAASRVITFSSDQKKFLERTYKVNPRAIEIVPNGVNSEFGPALVSNRAQERELRVLYVGRLTAQKAVPRLITAIAAMRQPVQALIVGDGDERVLIEDLLREYGLTNVDLAGIRRGAELVASYHWADVFVLPSDREGMPLAALEALACGLPVVATDVVGNRELLKDVGVLVKADAGALAQKLDELAQDPDTLAELRTQAISAAKEYTLDRLVAHLERIYAEMVFE